MFSTYSKQRKDFVRLTKLRETELAIEQLSDTVMILSYSPDVHLQLTALRARKQELFNSMEADIPWICKVLPIK